MNRAGVLLLTWIAILTIPGELAAGEECNYQQTLIPGNTYYVYNREYPNPYRGLQSCKWHANTDSSHRIVLNCSINLPSSPSCTYDKVGVQINQTTTYRYCGKGTFAVESEGTEMTITLWAPFWSRGGQFMCSMYTIVKDEDSWDEDCQCGWKNPSRIVGGMETGVNEFPMMAGLVDGNLRTLICGGTIISERHVLTAAHCLQGRDVRQLAILVGDHDLSTGRETNATALHPVAEKLIHPNYNESTFEYDIGIVKTAVRIIFSNEVGPACLPFQHATDSFGGVYVELLGWGTTEFGGEKSDTLQKVSVSVLDNGSCSRVYPNVSRREICTVGQEKDACQFDSGGPCLWQNPTTRRLVLVGIISHGGVCGYAPAVNTRVGAFISWIVQETPGARYCKSE